MKIINSKAQASDVNINYIIVLDKGDAELIINKYKTDKKYGEQNLKLTKYLGNLIRKYIQKNKIKEYLFGNVKSLSTFVSGINKSVGAKGSINTYRHMRASELNLTPEERVKLSKIMRHCPLTNLRYVRKILKEDK